MNPLRLRSIDHTGMVVASLDESITLYRDVLGLPLVHREMLTEQGVEAALLNIGDSHIELITPVRADSGVARFLAERGPGLHHIAYRVNDIDAALASLSAAGMRLIDEQPRTGIRGSRVAFLHPKAVGGVLTELVEPATHR